MENNTIQKIDIINNSNKTEKPIKRKKHHKNKKNQKDKIYGNLRHSVWNDYIGREKGVGYCFCCNNEQISRTNFECGHIQAESKGGETTLQNLRPICSSCNKSVGTQNMETYMKTYGFTKNANWDGIKKHDDIVDNNKLNNVVVNKIKNRKQHECPTCKHVFDKKCNLDDHLKKKNKCKPLIEPLIEPLIGRLTEIVPNILVINNANCNGIKENNNIDNNSANIDNQNDNIIDNNMPNVVSRINCHYCDLSFTRKDAATRHMKKFCPVVNERKKADILNQHNKVDIIDKLQLENKGQQEIIGKLQVEIELLNKIKLLEEHTKQLEEHAKQLEDRNKNLENKYKKLKKEIKNNSQIPIVQ